MKILCCGDRNWTDAEKIKKILSKYKMGYQVLLKNDIIIIHGNANGADKLSAWE